MKEQLTLGEKIRFLRERKNLAQKDLASQLGIAQQTLSHYEKGRIIPDVETVKKLAMFFNVTTDYLLNETSEGSIFKSKEDTIGQVNLYPATGDPMEDLPPEALKEIEDFRVYVRYKYKDYLKKPNKHND